MTKKIYLENLKSVLGRSVFHYYCHVPNKWIGPATIIRFFSISLIHVLPSAVCSHVWMINPFVPNAPFL